MSLAEKEAAVRLLLGGDFAAAERSALAMTQVHPLDAFGWKLLGAARVEMERPDDALAAWKRAVQLAPGDAEAHNNLGSLHDRLGNLSEAETCIREALAVKPDYVEALNNLGGVLNVLGRTADARACYEAALAIKPDYAACHEKLGKLKTYALGDPQLAVLQALHATARNDSDRKFVCFALAKACEDLTEYDQAFAFYREGNELRRKELGYAIDRDRKIFDWIKSTFNELPHAAAMPLALPTPILVVGMPRSGTSLVEQILASHSEVLGGGELEFLSRQVRRHVPVGSAAEFDLAAASRKISADYLEELNSIGGGQRFVTDKMPLNFRWLGLLLLSQPDVKVIHTVRIRWRCVGQISSIIFPRRTPASATISQTSPGTIGCTTT